MPLKITDRIHAAVTMNDVIRQTIECHAVAIAVVLPAVNLVSRVVGHTNFKTRRIDTRAMLWLDYRLMVFVVLMELKKSAGAG